jgi:hypothetical protein
MRLMREQYLTQHLNAIEMLEELKILTQIMRLCNDVDEFQEEDYSVEDEEGFL